MVCGIHSTGSFLDIFLHFYAIFFIYLLIIYPAALAMGRKTVTQPARVTVFSFCGVFALEFYLFILALYMRRFL